MLKFSAPTIEDAQWAKPIIAASGYIGSDASFANTFLWRNKYNTKICRFGDSLLKIYGDSENVFYSMPLGGDLRAAVDEIIADAYSRGSLAIGGVTQQNKTFLEETYPDKFTFELDRDNCDYIYTQEELSTLAGRKLQKKRNHISKFTRLYPDFSVLPITAENMDDAISVAKEWCILHGTCSSSNGLDAELCAIKTAFADFDELGMFGAVLYIEGKPVAMTAASEINSQVCDVHFEKALDFDGAYPMINREFAKLLSRYTYLNREEDMGIEGLRKAKLSYYPQILLEKYVARAVL